MANSIEDLKAKIDGLDVWEHIESASKIGFSAVDQELVPLFKWYGIYAQKPKEAGYFMLRIKIPGGILSAKQATTLNDLAERYAKGVMDITTRQAVQMHWIRIEDIPDILRELSAAGMDTAGGCGDILRNVTGCPLAGLTDDEVFDASEDLKKIDSFFVRNRDFSNLPRKYKMSVTGCKTWCSQPDINCVSLVAVKHPHKDDFGYTLKVGGGLSTKPIIAKNFPVFIPKSKALEVITAVTTVYRDHGFRDKRHQARIKFLVEDWGVEKFLQAVETILGYELEKVPMINQSKTGAFEYYPSPETSHHDHLGITKLKNGLFAVGIAFTSGRTNCPDLKNIAQLTTRYSLEGEIRTTNKQNLLITNIPEKNLDELINSAQKMNLKTQYSPFTRLGVACTGTEFCNLAIVETKAKARDLFDYLNTKFPEFQEDLMISVTGCPNNCAQYSVADIGLVGCKVKDPEGNMQDAFRIFLGGRLGSEAQFGKALDGRFYHQNIHLDLEKLLRYYLSNKSSEEKFRNFVDRNGIENIQKALQ
jgi:ferredoxin-nitrite reductase